MPQRTQNVSHVLDNPIPCQRGLIIHLNICWPNTSHASEDTECISTFVYQTHSTPGKICIRTCVDLTDPQAREDAKYISTHPMTAMSQNVSNLCWENPSNATKCILMSDDWTPYIPERTQVLFLLLFTKPSPWEWDTKYISTCVEQTHPITARTKNVDQIPPMPAEILNVS